MPGARVDGVEKQAQRKEFFAIDQQPAGPIQNCGIGRLNGIGRQNLKRNIGCFEYVAGGVEQPGRQRKSTSFGKFESAVRPFPRNGGGEVIHQLTIPVQFSPKLSGQIAAGIVDTDGDGIREIDGQNINLHYVSYENRLLNDFSNAHIQYLAEIGIGCTADYGSSDDQWSKLAAGDYDFNNNNWITVGTGDPYAYMANWATDTTYCGYSNPEYDALFEQLKSEMDEDKRADLIFQMQQILVDDAAVLIDGYYNSSMIYSKNVGNAHIHTADYYWLTTEITPAQ